MKPLHKLTPGERGFIVDMLNAELCERLLEMGIFPGDLVIVKETNLNNNSIIVSINNHTFNLHKKAAETIITNVVSFEISLN